MQEPMARQYELKTKAEFVVSRLAPLRRRMSSKRQIFARDRFKRARNLRGGQQPPDVAAEDERFLFRRQTNYANLVQLNLGMQPRSVGAEDQFPRPGAFDRLDDIIKTAHARRVGVNVGQANELIHYLLLRAPVVHKTAQARDDEVYVRVFRRQQINDVSSADHVHQHRNSQPPNRVTDFASGKRVVSVNLQAAKAEFADGAGDDFINPAGVALRVNRRKADQPVRAPGDDARQFGVGLSVVAVTRRDDTRLVDSGGARPAQVRVKRRVSAPRRVQSVAASGVAMSVNNHSGASSSLAPTSARKRAQVATP